MLCVDSDFGIAMPARIDTQVQQASVFLLILFCQKTLTLMPHIRPTIENPWRSLSESEGKLHERDNEEVADNRPFNPTALLEG